MTDEIGILCRNLYLGADFKMLVPKRTKLRLSEIVSNFYRVVESTRFTERARCLANEIVDRAPQVVCLQEVYRYQMIDPIGHVLMDEVSEDFLAILMHEIENHRKDVRYCIAKIANATQTELPFVWGQKEGELQVCDSVVILLREDVTQTGDGSATYTADVELDVPNKNHEERRTLQVKRAYCWVDIDWHGASARIANTHLESIDDSIQLLQANELIDAFMNEEGPVIIAGDMNAERDSLTYMAFLRAGFSDPFEQEAQDNWGATGADLRDEYMDLQMRIDHIFHRGGCRIGTEVFGTTRDERTPISRLWPSDHAGLMLKLLI